LDLISNDAQIMAGARAGNTPQVVRSMLAIGPVLLVVIFAVILFTAR
jgi:hypothetical protein